MDAVCAAAKEEGELNVIALAPTWANYGQMIDDFAAKYGIKVNSALPDASSQEEIDNATQLAGTGRQPDVFDLATTVMLANTDMFAPYQPATWADIPDGNKDPNGTWINNYAGFSAMLPTNSWPSTRPGLRRGSWPCQACMSEPQMPTASICSTTSPAARVGCGRVCSWSSRGWV